MDITDIVAVSGQFLDTYQLEVFCLMSYVVQCLVSFRELHVCVFQKNKVIILIITRVDFYAIS